MISLGTFNTNAHKFTYLSISRYLYTYPTYLSYCTTELLLRVLVRKDINSEIKYS